MSFWTPEFALGFLAGMVAAIVIGEFGAWLGRTVARIERKIRER